MEVTLGRDGSRPNLRDLAGLVGGHVFVDQFMTGTVFMTGYQRIERRELQGAIGDDSCFSPDDDAMIKLVNAADPALGIKTGVEIGQRQVDFEADPGVPSQVIQFFPLGGAVKVEVSLIVDEIHRGDVGIAIRPMVASRPMVAESRIRLIY
jgi:hypothetical protein